MFQQLTYALLGCTQAKAHAQDATQRREVDPGSTGGRPGQYLEVCDQVLKVMQLQKVVFALSKHSQSRTQHDVGAVLCQHHINHPAGERGREGAAEDGQEPLGSIQHRNRPKVLHAHTGPQHRCSYTAPGQQHDGGAALDDKFGRHGLIGLCSHKATMATQQAHPRAQAQTQTHTQACTLQALNPGCFLTASILKQKSRQLVKERALHRVQDHARCP